MVSVPEKAGFRVDARTRDGEISSEFPEVKIENGDREARASGSVGNATAHVVINNEHGGIELRKGSVVAEAPVPPKPPRMPAVPKVPVPTEN